METKTVAVNCILVNMSKVTDKIQVRSCRLYAFLKFE